MKSISAAMATHLAGSTTTLADCWLITRTDGAVFGFTSHDADLVISGQTYLAARGFDRTALGFNDTLSVDTHESTGLIDNATIHEIDLVAGLFDFAAVQIFTVNWADLSMGIIRLRSGWLGEIVVNPTGTFKTEMRGLAQLLTTVMCDNFMPVCRADLGDAHCKVNLAAISGTGTVVSSASNAIAVVSGISYTPGYDESIAVVTVTATVNTGLLINVTCNGIVLNVSLPTTYNSTDAVKFIAAQINAATSATFRISATVSFTVDNVHSVKLLKSNPLDGASVDKANDYSGIVQITNCAGHSRTTGDAYLVGGLVTWLTGSNTGRSMEIKNYTASTGVIELFLNMPFALAPGDTFTWTPGCDKRRETCFFRFNNILNFRAEPDMPGLDQMLKYPDA